MPDHCSVTREMGADSAREPLSMAAIIGIIVAAVGSLAGTSFACAWCRRGDGMFCCRSEEPPAPPVETAEPPRTAQHWFCFSHNIVVAEQISFGHPAN